MLGNFCRQTICKIYFLVFLLIVFPNDICAQEINLLYSGDHYLFDKNYLYIRPTDDVYVEPDIDCNGISKDIMAVDPSFGKTFEISNCTFLGIGIIKQPLGDNMFYGLRFNF